MVGICLAGRDASHPAVVQSNKGDFGMPNLMAHPAVGEELDLLDRVFAKFEEEDEDEDLGEDEGDDWGEDEDLEDEDDWDDEEWDEDEDEDWDSEDDDWGDEEEEA